jgi:hypothetical protein
LRFDLADSFEVLHKHAPLGGDLRFRTEMLQHASAAHAEVRTTRNDAVRRRGQYFFHDGFVVAPMLVGEFKLDALARQCADDEDRLAIDVGDAAAIVLEIGNIRFQNGHANANDRERSQNRKERR